MAKSNRWSKLITRRLAPQNAIAWNTAFRNMFEVYGTGVRETLTFFDGKKTDYYVDALEEKKLARGLAKLVRDEKRIRALPLEAKRFLEKKSEEIRRLVTTVRQKKTDKELLAPYRDVFRRLGEYYTRMWIVFLANEPLAEAVRSELLQRTQDEEATSRLLLVFSKPLELNDAMKERLELFSIAKRSGGKNPPAIAKVLDRHVLRFRHIPMFDVDHTPWDRRHFEKELSKITDAGNEISKIRKSLAERNRAFKQELAQLALPEKSRLSRLIRTLSAMAVLRDYRDSLRQKLNLTLQELYREIGRRAGLDLSEILLFSDREIESFLKGKIKAKRMKALARERKEAYLLIQQGKRIRILSGMAASQRMGKIRKENDVRTDAPLEGVAGSTGRAVGRAVIVHTNLDLGKVKNGDVLVAPITRQDFVPAMRKCAAFVTDEGGLTCHTAIIAREFKVPCLCGTKNATTRFRDGDVLEVDCEKGTVRKVKNPK